MYIIKERETHIHTHNKTYKKVHKMLFIRALNLKDLKCLQEWEWRSDVYEFIKGNILLINDKHEWNFKILYWAKENTKICMLYFPINIKLKNRQNWFMGKEIILLVFLGGGLSRKRHVKCYVSSYYSSKWNWYVFLSFIEPD